MTYVWWAIGFVAFFGCERVDKQAHVPAAVVFAYNGQEIFVGNEDVEPDPNHQYQGALKNLQAAFVNASPAKDLPAGSVGMLISYADKPTVQLPMQPIANLTRAAFGTQLTYRGRVGNALVDAVELGVDKLSEVSADRRILVVFSDGTDTDMATASDRLHAMKPQLEREHINAYLVMYGTDGPTPAAPGFYDRAVTVNSIDGIAFELGAIWGNAPHR
jgi:hypothetical protein